MAYNNYFPATCQPNYYGNPYAYQQYQHMMQQAAQQSNQAQQTIQQSGFVLVQSEQEARAYPVAPGNSITFKDERQPYCYVKTMGFNQLDQPTFERYRLVKEDAPTQRQSASVSNECTDPQKDTPYALKTEIEALKGEIEDLRAIVKAQSEKKATKAKKTEAEDDE